MRKLVISPDSDSYGLGSVDDTLSVDYGGGASGLRRNVGGAPYPIQVQWSVSGPGYSYLMAFFRTPTAYGSLPFLIDLLVDYSEIRECRARLAPGSLALRGKNGDCFIVSASLQVEALIADAAADLALIQSFLPR